MSAGSKSCESDAVLSSDLKSHHRSELMQVAALLDAFPNTHLEYEQRSAHIESEFEALLCELAGFLDATAKEEAGRKIESNFLEMDQKQGGLALKHGKKKPHKKRGSPVKDYSVVDKRSEIKLAQNNVRSAEACVAEQLFGGQHFLPEFLSLDDDQSVHLPKS